MAFPATGGTVEQLSDALYNARTLAARAKRTSQGIRNSSAAGDIAARGIVAYMDDLSSITSQFDTIKTLPGISQYAKDQYNDQAFDIVAEFNAMQTAITDTITWIDSNIPKDAGNRWLQVEEIVGGRLTERMLTPAQTAGLRTQVDILIATIN